MEGCSKDPFFRPALGQGQRKAGSDHIRGRRKRTRAESDSGSAITILHCMPNTENAHLGKPSVRGYATLARESVQAAA